MPVPFLLGSEKKENKKKRNEFNEKRVRNYWEKQIATVLKWILNVFVNHKNHRFYYFGNIQTRNIISFTFPSIENL